ncbi:MULTISPECIES: outer membrane protein [Brucella/Ochrobactrum group]|uniref:Outer membrane protein assembly factor YaeT n=1 Tax=Ochrobactrum soli TaxID=2448455 RepID=A0A2P9HJI7_9HYPH|nr:MULTISPECIES: outer membrane protein [Brucella]RRD27854.1 porin family protein [Brucellaceae bacterium VT-16-1752]WHT41291.1 porin family protein [Ochrobactrum sp. SSR]MDX4075417.1 outer membrane protein [Brucella sp. NBRC 113783]WHS32221.1 porin family protein [Brucella sp. NM4]SPL64268.1 Outer membrane protein assembly factor YaeT precursor [[Ochrobactrum] soli]
MKLKTLLLASTVALIAATGAKAADAVIEQEPAPVVVAPTFTWNGAYIGGQVGYGWGKSDFSGDLFTYGNVKPDGFLGGLYAGYNFDLGNNVVLGIDGDITYNDVSKGIDIYDGDLAVGSFENKLRWSGAVRARAGYAFDRFLPYIAGGVAFGNIKNSGDIDGIGFSESKTLTGWTIGGGVDYAATDNLILRLEYRYTDYGDKDLDFGGLSVNNDFKTNEVRLGVAYKF